MREVKREPVAGNNKVMEGLQRALTRAAKGNVRAVGIITVEHLGCESEYWGDENARGLIVFGCETLKHVIVSSTAKMHPQECDYQIAHYDIGLHPICYDVIPWLAQAEMARIKNGAPAPLTICFVRTTNSMVELSQDRMAFFEKVVRPALSLFGAIEDVRAAGGRYIDFVGLRDVADAASSGEQVPLIRPASAAIAAIKEQVIKDGPAPVTMTLRETGYYEYRNSNLEEWLKFARWLRKEGERVIVVRDTAKTHEPLNGFQTCPLASFDLHARAALYTQSRCNLFVQNGPWALAQFSDRPWLCFATIAEDSPEECNRPDWWAKFMGLNSQRQIAWAQDNQCIVYARDTFENMRRAYKDLRLA